MRISVIIPTHNPRPDYLARTLDALRAQTLDTQQWELLLVDNGSAPALDKDLVSWHPSGKIVRESHLGLTHARLAGLAQATGEVLVWSDDDNVLAADYLAAAQIAFANRPKLGAAGGKSLPVYETAPPEWYTPDLAPIGCRDLGDEDQTMQWTPSGDRRYPEHAPIGAGLVIRRSAMIEWQQAIAQDPIRRQLGRTGRALTSGEDNDINLTLMAKGWELGYLPSLQLKHLIPAGRLTLDYQGRIAHATFRDFTRVLLIHGVSPWTAIPGWTVPLRKLRAWFAMRPWTNPAAKIRWQGVCGHFEGRAYSPRLPPTP